MMIDNSYEEKQKDEILQQVNNILDSEDWGGKGESLVIEMVFQHQFDCRIFLRKKFKKKEVDK